MNQKKQRAKYLIADLLATSAGWLCFYVYRFDVTGYLTVPTLIDYLLLPQVRANLLLVPLAWMGLYAFSGYYQQPYFKSLTEELQTTFWTVLTGCLLAFFAMVIDDVPLVNDEQIALLKAVHVSPKAYLALLLTMFGCIFVPVYVLRYLITHRANTRIKQGSLGLRTLLIGQGKAAQQLQRELRDSRRQDGFTILHTIAEDTPTEQIAQVVAEQTIEAFILAPEHPDPRIINHLVYRLMPLGLPIRIKANNDEILNGQAHVSTLTSMPMILYSPERLSPFVRNVKRLADVACSAIALLVLLPVLLTVAVAIRHDSPGPIFFSQERVGQGGRIFRIYKFRSMHTDAEANGPQLSSADDARITRLGRVLRKYRLDELPQFYNVLRGDMSIVGPRPERHYYIQQLMDAVPYYARLLQVRPGITSWGQVKYGYASTIFQMIERVRYDLMYVNNYSLGMDIKILGYTIRTVLTGQGV